MTKFFEYLEAVGGDNFRWMDRLPYVLDCHPVPFDLHEELEPLWEKCIREKRKLKRDEYIDALFRHEDGTYSCHGVESAKSIRELITLANKYIEEEQPLWDGC